MVNSPPWARKYQELSHFIPGQIVSESNKECLVQANEP